MSNIHRRLGKAEKRLRIGEKPHLVTLLGVKISSDEFRELLKEIDGKSRGLPSEEETQEYQALCAGDTGI